MFSGIAELEFSFWHHNSLKSVETDKIVDFKVVQVSEVNNSNAMEREGFKRCTENIYEKGRKIMVVATDRHVGIRADMKRNFTEVDHQFDVCHLSKSITKKVN